MCVIFNQKLLLVQDKGFVIAIYGVIKMQPTAEYNMLMARSSYVYEI